MALRVALLTYDSRESREHAHFFRPLFGPAPTALIQGISGISGAKDIEARGEAGSPPFELHVLSFARQSAKTVSELAPGIIHHSLPLTWDGRLRFGYLGQIRALRRALAGIRPDVVHAQGMETWCAFAGLFLPYPKLLTIHGHLRLIQKANSGSWSLLSWLQMRMGEFSIPRYDGVVCISRHIQDSVEKQARKTFLIQNAIREEFFSTPQPEEKAGYPRKFLVIGTICPNKQQVEILRMLKSAREAAPDLFVTFAGSPGPDAAYNHSFSEELERCRSFAAFSGQLDLPQLIALLDSSQALIHCPREEAFGLVVAEALARNLDIFGFRLGMLRDHFPVTGRGAYLFDGGNWENLTSAIVDYHPEPGRRDMGGFLSGLKPCEVATRHWQVYRDIATVRNKFERAT